MTGVLMLESLTRGNTLKQGDKTPLTYKLLDADGDNLNVAGKTATVRLVHPNYLTIGYEKSGLLVSQDDTVTFTIDNIIPSRKYNVEIIVDDKFVFPSRSAESKFTIDRSSLGTEANIIEIVGKDVLISAVKSQVDTELQPLVTSLESAQQAEIQRASAESSRVSAEAQREIDHANRSAELDSKADKVAIENFNRNGNFSDGLTNWVGNTGAVLEQTPEGLTFNTDSVTAFYYSADNIINAKDFKSGDIIYSSISGIIEDTVPVNITIEFVGSPGVKILDFDPRDLGTDFTHSGLYTLDDGFYFSKIRYVYRFPSSDLSGTNIIRNVITINLTQTFGAGNEPTKEEMDALVKFTGYVDGEYALNNKEMLGYLMQNTALEDGSVTRLKLDSTLQSLLNDWEAVLTNENESWGL